jgi:hypothetical protein
MFQTGKGTNPVDLMETVHIELPDETRELFDVQSLGEREATEFDQDPVYKRKLALTLLCLK